jgi:hypothetical protein
VTPRTAGILEFCPFSLLTKETNHWCVPFHAYHCLSRRIFEPANHSHWIRDCFPQIFNGIRNREPPSHRGMLLHRRRLVQAKEPPSPCRRCDAPTGVSSGVRAGHRPGGARIVIFRLAQEIRQSHDRQGSSARRKLNSCDASHRAFGANKRSSPLYAQSHMPTRGRFSFAKLRCGNALPWISPLIDDHSLTGAREFPDKFERIRAWISRPIQGFRELSILIAP